MLISFSIPTWLLWAGGVVGGLVVLGLAVLGCVALYALYKWNPPSW